MAWPNYLLHLCHPSLMSVVLEFLGGSETVFLREKKKRNYLINTVYMTCFLERGRYSFSPHWHSCLLWLMCKLVYEKFMYKYAKILLVGEPYVCWDFWFVGFGFYFFLVSIKKFSQVLFFSLRYFYNGCSFIL